MQVCYAPDSCSVLWVTHTTMLLQALLSEGRYTVPDVWLVKADCHKVCAVLFPSPTLSYHHHLCSSTLHTGQLFSCNFWTNRTIQWTLWIRDTSPRRTLSAVPTTSSWPQIYLWIRDTSLYRTASWVPAVPSIERFHCIHSKAHQSE